jgi:hypothetical protein
MDNVLFVNDTKDLTVRKISKSPNGECYLTKDNMVFKCLEYPEEKNLNRLSNYYSSHFVFPRTLVYTKQGKLIGYIMEYAFGDKLTKLPEFVSFEKYNNEVERVEREVEVLTCYKLRLLDLSKRNILYSDRYGMKVIDTDLYSPNKESKRLYLLNKSNYASAVMSPITDISNPRFKSDKLNKYTTRTLDGMMRTSDYIGELVEATTSIGFSEPKTVKELSLQLKLL